MEKEKNKISKINIVAAAAVAIFCLLSFAGEAKASTTKSFYCNDSGSGGSAQAWTVPPLVTSLTVTLAGGGGSGAQCDGDGNSNSSEWNNQESGDALINQTITVVPGHVLNISAGCGADYGGVWLGGLSALQGWGDLSGQPGDADSYEAAGSGGGASSIRDATNGNIVLAAANGGQGEGVTDGSDYSGGAGGTNASTNTGLSTYYPQGGAPYGDCEESGNDGWVQLTYSGGTTTYTVTYNGINSTGGTAPTDSNNYTSGQTVIVLGTGSLVRTNYAFAGWNTASDGSGTTYTQGNTFPIYSNTPLYAKWTSGTGYTITTSTVVSSGSGGISASQSGITAGTNSTVTIMPAVGSVVSGVTDNGVQVGTGAATNATPFSYSIPNISANHTVVATFATGTYLSQSVYTSNILPISNTDLGFANINYLTSLTGATNNIPAGTTLEMRVRSCDDANCTNEDLTKPFSSCGMVTNTVGNADLTAGTLAQGSACLTAGDGFVQYQVSLATTLSTAIPSFGPVTFNNVTGYSKTWQTLVSSPFDTGSTYATIGNLQWGLGSGSNTNVKFQMRTAPDSATTPGTPDWASGSGWCGPGTSANCDVATNNSPGNGTTGSYYTAATGNTINSTQSNAGATNKSRWIQYAAFMQSQDGTLTPTPVKNVNVSFNYNVPPVIDTAVPSQVQSGANASKLSVAYTMHDLSSQVTTSVYPELFYQSANITLSSAMPATSSSKTFNTTCTSAAPCYWPVAGDTFSSGNSSAFFNVGGGGGGGVGGTYANGNATAGGFSTISFPTSTVQATATGGQPGSNPYLGGCTFGNGGSGSGSLGGQTIYAGGVGNGGSGANGVGGLGGTCGGGGGGAISGFLSGAFSTSSQVKIIVGAGGLHDTNGAGNSSNPGSVTVSPSITISTPNNAPIPTSGLILIDKELMKFSFGVSNGDGTSSVIIIQRGACFDDTNPTDGISRTGSYCTTATTHSASAPVYFMATTATGNVKTLTPVDLGITQSGSSGTVPTPGASGGFNSYPSGVPSAISVDSSGVHLNVPTGSSFVSYLDKGSANSSLAWNNLGYELSAPSDSNVTIQVQATSGGQPAFDFTSATCFVTNATANSAVVPLNTTCAPTGKEYLWYQVTFNASTSGQSPLLSSVNATIGGTTTKNIIWDAKSELPGLGGVDSLTGMATWPNFKALVAASDGSTIGNSVGTLANGYALDYQPPTITNVLPTNNAFINTTSSKFSYTTSEGLYGGSFAITDTTNGNTLQTCTLPSALLTAVSYPHTFTLTDLSTANCGGAGVTLTTNHVYTMAMAATDLDGNSTTTASQTFTYDTTPPTVTGISAVNPNQSYSLGAKIQIQLNTLEPVTIPNANAITLNLSNGGPCVFGGINTAIQNPTCTYIVPDASHDTQQLTITSISPSTITAGLIIDRATNGNVSGAGFAGLGSSNNLTNDHLIIDTVNQERFKGSIGMNGSVTVNDYWLAPGATCTVIGAGDQCRASVCTAGSPNKCLEPIGGFCSNGSVCVTGYCNGSNVCADPWLTTACGVKKYVSTSAGSLSLLVHPVGIAQSSICSGLGGRLPTFSEATCLGLKSFWVSDSASWGGAGGVCSYNSYEYISATGTTSSNMCYYDQGGTCTAVPHCTTGDMGESIQCVK